MYAQSIFRVLVRLFNELFLVLCSVAVFHSEPFTFETRYRNTLYTAWLLEGMVGSWLWTTLYLNAYNLEQASAKYHHGLLIILSHSSMLLFPGIISKQASNRGTVLNKLKHNITQIIWLFISFYLTMNFNYFSYPNLLSSALFSNEDARKKMEEFTLTHHIMKPGGRLVEIKLLCL